MCEKWKYVAHQILPWALERFFDAVRHPQTFTYADMTSCEVPSAAAGRQEALACTALRKTGACFHRLRRRSMKAMQALYLRVVHHALPRCTRANFAGRPSGY